MKAALYARVSSKEQLESYSIDAQKRAFRLLCQVETEIKNIKGELSRIKNLYRIVNMEYAQYLAERQQLQAKLAKLTLTQSKPDHLERMAQFLKTTWVRHGKRQTKSTEIA